MIYMMSLHGVNCYQLLLSALSDHENIWAWTFFINFIWMKRLQCDTQNYFFQFLILINLFGTIIYELKLDLK